MTCSGRRGAPGLRDEDIALWRRAVSADTPLRGAPPPPAPPVEPEAAPALEGFADISSLAPAPPPAAPAPGGLDRRTAQRLRRGQIEVEERLDLHGMTRTQAHRALARALAAAQARGTRCMLVITGKGVAGGETGVLRRMVPRWLEEPPNAPRVLGAAPARARDGGGGALYVLMRRRRRGPEQA